MKNYIKMMRVHHYIKNILIFAPLACSGEMFAPGKLTAGLLGFAAFCLISSVVYIVNDIRDVEKDRLHPVKCARPIASGAVSVRAAWITAGCLLAGAAVCDALVFRPLATALLIAYLLLNMFYSFGLKNVPIADVSILVAGFLIRMLFGALITGITVSGWLYLTVLSLSFYFALGKRRNELKRLGDSDTRQVLRQYPVSFLDKNMYMFLTLAHVFYSLWCLDKETSARPNSKYLVFTVPIVLLITMKYSLDIEGDSDGDPVEVLLHDKALLAVCLVYFAAMFLILYL